MKKVAAAMVVLAIALIATGAQAFSVSVPGAPSEVNQATNMAKDTATSSAMSKSAQDKINAYNCKFTGTSADISCANGKSFSALVNELKGINTTGKMVADKRLKIDASVACPKKGDCSERESSVRNQLEKLDSRWWNVYVRSSGKGDALRMTASTD